MTAPAYAPLILAVDDEGGNLLLLRQILQRQYRLLFAKDGERAIELARAQSPDLILLDVMMPDVTGHEVCRRLKSDPTTSRIPVIFVTALTDAADEIAGFEAGGVDYIGKPLSPPIVLARVRAHLSLVRLEDLKETRLQIVQRLGLAAEYKDNETGLHVIRMSHYAHLLGLAAGLGPAGADDLLNAAPMHDVGKIGIPDGILLKPGPLTEAERRRMETHTVLGEQMLGGVAFLHGEGLRVVRSHHERWDGTGYPDGIGGTEIPLGARIFAVADTLDAMTSDRPYRRAMSWAAASREILAESKRQFDPDVVEAFVARERSLRAIRREFAAAA